MKIGLGLGLTGAGASRPFAFYVDSVNGSDANNGRSPALAKQTIAGLMALSPAAGARVGLARGSYWREMLKPTNAMHIAAYGSGATPPTLDGADVITPVSFTPNATFPTTVYDVSLSRDPSGVYVSGDTYMMWENGAWLTRVVDLATCNSTAGSYFVSQPNALAAPSVANVHPFGNTDPRSDGKTYEYSKRSSGIEMAHLDNCTVEGVHVKRGNGAYGSGTGGTNHTWRRCLFSYGGKHNSVTASGLYEDCVAFDLEDARQILADGGRIPFTFYKPSTAGLTAIIRRCLAVMPTGRTNTASQAFYGHNSAGALYTTTTVDGFISLRAGSIVPQGITITMNDVCSLDQATTGIQLPPNASGGVTCLRALVRGPALSTPILYPSAGGTAGYAVEVADAAIHIQGTSAGTGVGASFQIAGIINLHHSIISMAGSNLPINFGAAGVGSQSKNNIVVNQRSLAQTWWQGDQNAILADNVYAEYSTGTRTWWQTPGAGTAATLAAWVVKVPTESNSVNLSSAQTDTMLLGTAADLANGDFRLQPTSGGFMADGTTPIYGNIGPRYHYNWNTKAVEAGPPAAFPTPPATEAQCAAYVVNPASWNFYP